MFLILSDTLLLQEESENNLQWISTSVSAWSPDKDLQSLLLVLDSYTQQMTTEGIKKYFCPIICHSITSMPLQDIWSSKVLYIGISHLLLYYKLKTS